ncbi:DNA translocase FtsK [Intestinimonas timonensis]|uniref:FtsK/SpoIIIE family DNA translocase n=1 Tax=Intestinimonas timonensis TaxID=1689270 RepID=UPI0023F3923C|nr:DNA translocase FtsK [Intestinimonas timonensis]
MATTRKKTTGGKRTASSGGKRSGSSSSAAKKSGGSRSRSTPPQPKPIRREVGAVICLLLAFFAAFGYFNIQAIFIDLFCSLLKGLFGYGFWLAPPMLVVASYILAFHRGRPVRLRLWCALLTPLVMGAILHLFLYKGEFAFSMEAIGGLWKQGETVQCGGVVSGLIAETLTLVFSPIGAGLILILAQLLMFLGAFHLSVPEIVDAIRNRPRAEYEYVEEEEPEPEERPVRRRPEPERRRSAIDIPVDDGPAQQTEKPQTQSLFPRKERLFNRKAGAMPPDQVLTGARPMAAEPQPEPSAPQPEPVPAPATEPAPAVQPVSVIPPVPEVEPEPAILQPEPEVAVTPPPMPLPEIVREPAVEKVSAKEAQAEAAKVGEDIEKTMAESTPAVYQYPPVSLLTEGGGDVGAGAQAELKMNQERLADTIRSFGIEAQISDVTRGPSVTRYEVELDQGVRLNKLTNLSDDIALALGATGVRIAPIPDKIATVGIEVPNKLVSPVHIHEVIDSKEFRDHSSKVAFAVGKDIAGNCIVGNIAKLPHLLIAGTTGSGKSVCTNSLIISLLYKATPEEVRLIMVDPKMVELGIYNGIPHLLIPVVTDPKKAAGALQWAVTEMMKRYRAFSEVGVRDLASYNAHAAKTEGMEKMPQIVVVIDELADLMLVAAKEVEESICRVAQMGRAAGMHLIIATQRPSADVITGLMKANIPSRIAFAVASALESRIILDTTGAEKLVGRGDMLYFPLGSGKPLRVQGCLISDEEVASVVSFIKEQSTVEYDESVIHEIEQHAAEKEKGGKGVGGSAPEEVGEEYDELLPAAIEVVVETGMASVSMLQRRLKLGYSRAARLVDQMEEKGVVGPFEGSKPRQVLITKEQWQEMQFKQGMVDRAPEPVPDELEFEGDAIPQSREMPPFDME